MSFGPRSSLCAPGVPPSVQARQSGPVGGGAEVVQVKVRCRDRRVPHPRLDGPWVHAAGKPQAGRGVSQVVDPTTLRKRRPAEGALEGRRVQTVAGGRDEQRSLGLPVRRHRPNQSSKSSDNIRVKIPRDCCWSYPGRCRSWLSSNLGRGSPAHNALRVCGDMTSHPSRGEGVPCGHCADLAPHGTPSPGAAPLVCWRKPGGARSAAAPALGWNG